MYSLYQVKQEGLWLSLKMQRKGWKPGDFGSPGWKLVRSLISAPPHKVVIGSRMHGQPLTCWQRQQRGVPGDGSEDTTLLWSARVLCQPSAPRVGPKATLSPKQARTFLDLNTCCILAWRKLHFTSINTISTLSPACKALQDPSRWKMLQKYQPVTYLLFWQPAFLGRRQETSFLCCFCYCPFSGYFRKALTGTYCVREAGRVQTVSSALCRKNTDVLPSFTLKCLSASEDFLLPDFYRDFPPVPHPRVCLPYTKWIVSL